MWLSKHVVHGYVVGHTRYTSDCAVEIPVHNLNWPRKGLSGIVGRGARGWSDTIGLIVTLSATHHFITFSAVRGKSTRVVPSCFLLS